MSEPDLDPVEDLVAEAIVRMELEGEGAVDEICARDPERAGLIRSHLAAARELGLVGDLGPGRPIPGRIGPFRLEERIGEGGMGIVFRASQDGLSRPAALKLIRPEYRHLAGARERFEREARAASKLDHPGIVRVLAFGEERGQPYMAMEWVSGASLADILRLLGNRDPGTLSARDAAAALAARSAVAPRLSESEASAAADVFSGDWERFVLRLMRQAALAIDHAHALGVTHRDLKPSNLMLTPTGRLVVLDFGLARTDEVSDLTASGAPLGSLPYVAPEVLRGLASSPAADVYGLGATLYELLTMRRPFEADGAEALRARIIAGGPDSPSLRNPCLSRDAATIALVALDPEPLRRYASAGALALDLTAVLDGRPIKGRRPGPLDIGMRFVRRHPARVLAGVLGLLALVVAPSVLLFREIEFGRRIGRESETARREAELSRETVRLFERMLDSKDSSLWFPDAEQGIGLLETQALPLIDRLADKPIEQARLLFFLGRAWEGFGRQAEATAAFGAAVAAAAAGGTKEIEIAARGALIRLELSTGSRSPRAIADDARTLDAMAAEAAPAAQVRLDTGIVLARCLDSAGDFEGEKQVRDRIEAMIAEHPELRNGNEAALTDTLVRGLLHEGKDGEALDLARKVLDDPARRMRLAPANVLRLSTLAANAASGLGLTQAVDEILERARADYRARLPDRPCEELAALEIKLAMNLLFREGEIDEAVSLARAARPYLSETPSGRLNAALADYLIAKGLIRRGEREKARPLLENAERMARANERTNPARWATLTLALADLDGSEGKVEAALSGYRLAITGFLEGRPPEPRRAGRACIALSSLLRGQGEVEEADRLLERSIELLTPEGDWDSLLQGHGFLATRARDRGDPERARAEIRLAFAAAEKLGVAGRRDAARARAFEADLAARDGDHEAAAEAYESAAGLLLEGDPAAVAAASDLLAASARHHVVAGDDDEAIRVLVLSIDRLDGNGLPAATKTLERIDELARRHRALGDRPAEIRTGLDGLRRCRRGLGDRHPTTIARAEMLVAAAAIADPRPSPDETSESAVRRELEVELLDLEGRLSLAPEASAARTRVRDLLFRLYGAWGRETDARRFAPGG